MSYVLTAIVFIIVFSVLILIHEFGHFIMAKRSGIKVEEFGIGLPPRIWGKKKGETIYSVNWIPFGGFVRMLGETGSDPKLLKNKRSLLAKPMRTRVKVIIAGVVMNFLLAWVLLSVGFTVGMQPLLTSEEVLDAVADGVIELEEGLKIKELNEGGLFDSVGFESEDVIYFIDGEIVDEYMVEEITEDPIGIYKVVRGNEVYTYEIIEEQLEEFTEEDYGIVFYDNVPFPRVKIYDLKKESKAYEAGLRPDDIIISVNGQEVFYVSELEYLARGQPVLEYEIYRDGFIEGFIVDLDQGRKVIISSVIPGDPASRVGLKSGDVIISVNGNLVVDSLEFIDFIKSHSNGALAILVERDGERIFIEVEPEDGLIGAYMSELISYSGEQEMSLYNTNLLSSVIEIKEEKYPFYISIYKSFGEGVRLVRLTGSMFVSFISDFISKGEIPETLAGPVGIASLTHTFVSEGFIPLIQFVALISLSLAVINILPFPALDGGRLLFILVEFIIGRRINPKWESAIHALGFVLLMVLILAITYNDILKLING